MSSCKASALELCRALKKLDKQDLNFLIPNLSDKCIEKISELYFNIQNGAGMIPNGSRKRRLKKCMLADKKNCMYISTKNKSIPMKRTILKRQVGSGIFTTILAIAIPLITSLIAKNSG